MKEKILPIVAIVGEPNVGKSTLLNKISGDRSAITSKVSGTTRDRQYIDTAWNGVEFTLVDTAGITFGQNDLLENKLNDQIEVAVKEAKLILFVVDKKAGSESVDRKTILKFRKSKVPVALVVNKSDSPKDFDKATEIFKHLGIKPSFAVSGITGRGIGDLLDFVASDLKKRKLNTSLEKKATGICVSLVGKPNVGKSSLFNKIIKSDRVVVSPVPGTTRAAIDTQINIDGQDYTFIDTAGLKKKEYRQEQPDVFAGYQSFKSMRRSDVCFLVIDATLPITKQDQAIAREIFELSKGAIILANKMDLYEGDEQKLRDYISNHFPFLWMCPMFTVSADTGEGLKEALEAIKPIYEARQKEIEPMLLDNLLNKKMRQNPPKLLRDQKKPKVFNLNQIATNPPLFELVVNYPAAISMQFRKAVQNAIIKDLGFWGTPVNMILRGKDKK